MVDKFSVRKLFSKSSSQPTSYSESNFFESDIYIFYICIKLVQIKLRESYIRVYILLIIILLVFFETFFEKIFHIICSSKFHFKCHGKLWSQTENTFLSTTTIIIHWPSWTRTKRVSRNFLCQLQSLLPHQHTTNIRSCRSPNHEKHREFWLVLHTLCVDHTLHNPHP